MNTKKQKKRAPAQPNTDSEGGSDPTTPRINCAFDVRVSIEKLVPNPRNPNTHPEEQIRLLAKAILHQGWRSPIVLSKRSGCIVAGHARYEAAKILGLTQVPVDYQDFASDEDELAHLVADNRIAELSETDKSQMQQLFLDFRKAGFDTELAGFDAKSVERELEAPAEPKAPDAFPEVDETLATDYQCPRCEFQWSGKAS